MCGRFEFDLGSGIEELQKIDLDIKRHYDTPYKTGEIFPTDIVPVLIKENDRFQLKLMNWGFPKWDGKGHIINTKSETAHEKKLFAESLRQRRCVIISTGFYEWSKPDSSGNKMKFHFRTPTNSVFYMAGIYNTYIMNDEYRQFFSIFTREANSSIVDIHTRMPVPLYKSDLKDWLKNENMIETFFQRDDIPLFRTMVS